MKRKLPSVLILLVMVLMGAMYWVDLSYYTDPTTGFLIGSPVWIRYAALALPLLMALLGLRTVGPGAIGVLRVRNRALAVCFLLAAAVGVAYGLTQIFFSLRDFSVYALLMGIAFTWYGVWMFLCALQQLVQSTPSPTQSALLGVLAALPYCALTIYRVMVKPTSLYRLGPLVSTFAALLALLWLGALLRAFYIAMPVGRMRLMYVLGIFTFLFGTCLELPQAVHTALTGGADPLALMEAVNMALLGVVAGAVSVSMAGMGDAVEDGGKLRPVD